MMIVALIGLGVVLFVLGVSFVFKGYLSTPNENAVVPVKDFEKTRQETAQLKEREIQLKAELENLRRVNENLKAKAETAEAQTTTLKERAAQLEADFLTLQSKADSQAKEALEVVERLGSENNVLKTELGQFKTSDDQQKNTAMDRFNGLRRESEDLLKKLQDSQAQLEQSQIESAKLHETISLLNVQIENFKFDKNKDQTQIESLKTDHTRQLTQAFDSMRTEKQSLQASFEEKILTLHKLEGEHQKLQADNEKLRQEVATLTESCRQLKSLEENRLNQVNSLTQELESLKETDVNTNLSLENLRRDKDALYQSKMELEKDLQKLKEFNAALLEKDQMVQFELAKNRAQAMGLEKVCEEFKEEIEAKLKEIKDLNFENNSLRKMYEETQQDLLALKNSHAELTKQEKLSKYELEKNKAQLEGLEKVYSDFRSKFEHIEALHKEMSHESQE